MEEEYSKLKLKNQICFPLYLCSKELIRRYTPLLNDLNLTYTQYVVMMYFWEKEKSSLKRLSNMILLDSGTLTPVLRKLEDKGYLKRSRSSKDERNLMVKITEEGRKLKEKAVNIPDEISKCLKLSEKDAKSLYMLCYKALFNLESEGNNGDN